MTRSIILKRKYKSKKSSNLLHDTFKCQVLSDSNYFMGALCAQSKGLINLRQVQAYILLLRRAVGKGRIGWSRVRLIFNLDYHKTEKPSGHRMGHGKGKGNKWSRVVLPGLCFLKVVSYSDQYVFFDHLSWTCIFAYLDYSFISYIGIGFPRVRETDLEQVGIYSGSLDIVEFAKFLPGRVESFEFQENLNYNSFVDSFFDFMFHFGLGVVFLRNDVDLLRSRVKRTLSFSDLIYLKLFLSCLFSAFFLSNRLRLPNQKSLVFFEVKKSSISFFSVYLIQAWFFGYFFQLLNHSFSLRLFSKFARCLTNLSHILENSFLHTVKLLFNTFSSFHGKKYSSLSEVSMTEFMTTDYPAEVLHHYGRRRSTRLQAVYRGLRRIKNKLPFRSEIILPTSLKYSFYSRRRKTRLEHRNQASRS
jgi:ribosomal protein L16/L10AE